MGMTAAIVLFVVALLAELIAVGLIVAESRKAGTLLCEYLARNPDNHENGTRDQGELEQPILEPCWRTRTAGGGQWCSSSSGSSPGSPATSRPSADPTASCRRAASLKQGRITSWRAAPGTTRSLNDERATEPLEGS